jgi:hypothetical protein
VAGGEQVARYLERYGQVIVTNYREFVLVGRDRSGGAVEIESFRIAKDAEGFWRAAESHRRTAAEMGPGLHEFLKRAMLHGVPLSQPRDLAWFLASHAREALALVEAADDPPTVSRVRGALEQALGVGFEGDRGEHFSAPPFSRRFSTGSSARGCCGARRGRWTARSASTGGSRRTS